MGFMNAYKPTNSWGTTLLYWLVLVNWDPIGIPRKPVEVLDTLYEAINGNMF